MICQISAVWREETPLEIASGSAQKKVSGCTTGLEAQESDCKYGIRGIGQVKAYVTKRCGHVDQRVIFFFFLHFGIPGVKLGVENTVDLTCATTLPAPKWCNTSLAC